MRAPALTFFVELAADPLAALFTDGRCADFLVRGGFGLSMGMIDVRPERAAIVRALERRGVPVTAWILLDEAHGYWLNADNAAAAVARYRHLRAWAAAERLALPRVGLDVEFPRADGELLMREPQRGFVTLLRRRRPAAVARAERTYAELVAEIRADGRRVEAYHLPHLLDERASRSTLLRRTLGLVDVDVDLEVHMLYSTYLGAPMSRSYMPEAPAIALGSTGGGVDAGTPAHEARRLRWSALEADLLAAAAHTRDLYVFSLEGCVEQGLLDPLLALDWSRPAPPLTAAAARGAARARRRLRLFLRAEPVIDLVYRSRRPGKPEAPPACGSSEPEPL
jgi:hypothetical protein